jgi:CheY-like chemotaxis protein
MPNPTEPEPEPEGESSRATDIALELNNLLTVVLGSVALARNALAHGADPVPHLDELQRAAEQAAGFSRRLMGLSRGHVPLEIVDVADALATREAEPARKVESGALVIVAEDEPMVAELTRRILVHAGHRVMLCKDGLEALEYIRAHHDEVALVVSDIVMPRLSGLELVAQLATELPDLPVLLASGYPEDERRLNDPTLAAVAFLPKPYRAADLLAAVSQLLQRHAQRTPGVVPLLT